MSESVSWGSASPGVHMVTVHVCAADDVDASDSRQTFFTPPSITVPQLESGWLSHVLQERVPGLGRAFCCLL